MSFSSEGALDMLLFVFALAPFIADRISSLRKKKDVK